MHFRACGTLWGTFPHEANGTPPQTGAQCSEFPPPPFCMKSWCRLSFLTCSLCSGFPQSCIILYLKPMRLVLSPLSLHVCAGRCSSSPCPASPAVTPCLCCRGCAEGKNRNESCTGPVHLQPVSCSRGSVSQPWPVPAVAMHLGRCTRLQCWECSANRCL